MCAKYRNPVGIITKSPLIERDLDLLLELQATARLGVSLSVPFIDAQKARIVEPWVATPARRLRAIETLAKAGLRVGVMTAPLIPGLNDEEMPAVLAAAASAGATSAGYVLLRLPGSVKAVFEARLRAAFPERAEKILHRIVEVRGGTDADPKLYDARFGRRQTGEGAYAAMIGALFRQTAKRHGLNVSGDVGVIDGQDRAHDGTLWSELPTTFVRPETATPPATRSSQKASKQLPLL